MSPTKIAAALTLSIAMLIGGCKKTDSTTPPPAGVSANQGGTPAAPSSVAAVTAMTELAATYNAVSDVEGHPDQKRDQKLILKADGTAELDTTEVEKAKPATVLKSDVGTGTFTAGPKDVVATFTLTDGKSIKPIVMKLTRDTGGKGLTGDDGRTFEKAK
jgi:hypothetical protein